MDTNKRKYIVKRVRYLRALSVLSFLVGPTLVFARTLKEIMSLAVNVLNSVVQLIMVLALLGFIAGAIRFIYTAGDDRSRAEGKRMMVWGTLALFVMVSLWGIVEVVKATFFGN